MKLMQTFDIHPFSISEFTSSVDDKTILEVPGGVRSHLNNTPNNPYPTCHETINVTHPSAFESSVSILIPSHNDLFFSLW